jgi:hypothetical protein
VKFSTIPIIFNSRLILEQYDYYAKKTGYTVFCGAKSFNLFENDITIDLIYILKLSFIFLFRKIIKRPILDFCYEMILYKILKALKKHEYINISCDKSSITYKNRIINYFIVISTEQSFYIKLNLIKNKIISTEKQVD